MRKLFFLLFFVASVSCSGQGYNNQWLMGYYPFSYLKGRMFYTSSNDTLIYEYRKMMFNGAEATICDSNGNFLMSSNGVWIANSNNDTMMNGTGLNPGYFVNSFPNSNGSLIDNGNLFLPFPNNSNKYVLFHQTEDDVNYPSNRLYYSVIDMTLDSGLGGVISKNDTAFNDTICWGIAACKHANGRDWWIAAFKDNTDTIYMVLLTPNGIASITKQSLGFGYATPGNSSQMRFSNDGDKFIYGYSVYFQNKFNVELSDFDRCTGLFSNNQVVQVSNSDFVWGQAFSPNGQFVYASTSNYIFQINTTTYSVDTVAIYDGYYDPPNAYTTFFNMYLAANGKIYITSGGSALRIHEMNFPDSAGMACSVQQHSINLGFWNFRAVPNHPNYYLGRLIGSPCDTVWSGIKEPENDFRFRVYPNPVTSNVLNIGYLLPTSTSSVGESGLFQIIDVTGKIVFKYALPQWSNEQSFQLPTLANGLYQCIIRSDNKIAFRKLIILHD